jgi:hypothetical protein
MRLVAFLVIVVAVIASNANAAIIARCGASSGFAFYFQSAIVPADQAGWSDDAVGDGEIQLIVDASSGPDIVYSDAVGTRSATAEGALVTFVGGAADGFLIVLLVYPNRAVLEHYVFQLDDAGNGTVVWGSARAGGMLQKSNLLVAECRAR